MNADGAPRAVVFDLDGTLLDSLQLVLAAITHAVGSHGPAPTRALFANLGGPPASFLPTLLRDPNELPQATARLAAFHRENTHLIQPFPGVDALFRHLHERGCKTAVWTGRDRVSAEWLLDMHHLTARLDTVVCGDDLPTHKPEPEGLREIVRRLGVAPSETVFVGDADVDVLGGAACGVDTILIRHERSPEAHIVAKSWRLVTTPQDAFAAVLERFGSDATARLPGFCR